MNEIGLAVRAVVVIACIGDILETGVTSDVATSPGPITRLALSVNRSLHHFLPVLDDSRPYLARYQLGALGALVS